MKQKFNTKECHYCKKPIEEKVAICSFCGYDHKTGTMTESQSGLVKSLEEKVKTKEKRAASRIFGVDPKVRGFAFIGLSIVVFSVFYKYNFDIKTVMSRANQIFPRIKSGTFLTGKSKKAKDKASLKIELTNVRSLEAPKKSSQSRDSAVEGILYDPTGKSFVSIDGNVIAEGATFKDVVVKKINRDSVELIIKGENKIIEVQEQ
ncbi:MAG: hypothetical protein NTW64_02600 [Candidatus Omnitrophica bacterium]|nr:hypothetical protein [Candidatus Omnitrophota bacterium]